MVKGSPVHESFFLVFATILPKLGVNSDNVETVYIVDNAVLRLNLRNSLQLLKGKLADTKSLFRKEDWKTGPESAAKRQVLYHLGDFVSGLRKKDWNTGDQPPVVPVVQKMPEKLAWLIARHGFGIMPFVERGDYGRGLYFTTSLEYLESCTEGLGTSEGEGYVYLMSLVLPGNAFPVVEKPDSTNLLSLAGSPCRPGYQSHYAIGEKGGFKGGELVVFDPAQALPFFIWNTLPSSPIVPRGSTLVRKDSGASANRPEWNYSLDASWNCEELSFLPSFSFLDFLCHDVLCWPFPSPPLLVSRQQ